MGNFIGQDRYKGILMVTFGATLWGLSGTAAQQLFQNYGVPIGWLVTIRLLFSGVALIAIGLLSKDKEKVWAIWKDRKTRLQLLLFGILGLLGVQYTYFASIETGNSAVATLLQYLAPIFITVYFILRHRVFPGRIDLTAILLALLGTFLLLTNGSIKNFAVSNISVAWGILSGIALAFYTIYPVRLLKKWGSIVVVGWGMIIGGIGLSFIHPPWKIEIQDWSIHTLSLISFVIIFGTLIAFFLYLESLRFITPKETSLLSCTEPLVAVISAIIWLHVSFGVFQAFGALCVMAMVIILSFKSNEPQKKLTVIEDGRQFQRKQA
ncbi:EamA family transporter [Bacillus methanolicus]|nr:EamA family transporter [Bacillus methanolicus]